MFLPPTKATLDADWIRHAMSVFGWMVPGEARAFPGTELDAATAWVTGPEAG